MTLPLLLLAALGGQLGPADSLRAAILQRIASESGATVAVALRDPSTGFLVLVEPDLRFHAASTMKVPVLIELARRVDAKELRWTDSLAVKNEFASIVDGSPFTLDPKEDGDSTVYAAIGTWWPIRRLATRMIVRSSNLATNLLIERLDARRVTATIRRLGADSMVVLRGVEDGKAFEKGLNNTTTARGLLTLFERLATGTAVSGSADAGMIEVLKRQQTNDSIPAGLPTGTPVAHKTGNITRIRHDAGIVYGPRPYILVVLVRGIEDQQQAAALIARLSKAVYDASATDAAAASR